MIAKHLTIELIANKVLQEAREAFIAVAMVTDEAFELFNRNINKNAKLNFLLGLNLPTSPSVLKTLLDNESRNIDTKIYVQDFFHPKLYLFRLKNNEWIAFVGSGNFTMGGFRKNKELFVKITDESTCFGLRDWFSNACIDAKPLSYDLIEKYIPIYNSKKLRQAEDDSDNYQFIQSINSNFNIDDVDFSNQFFNQKEHLLLSPTNSVKNDDMKIKHERWELRTKLFQLNDLMNHRLKEVGNLHQHYVEEYRVASILPQNHHGNKIEALWIAYGRSQTAIKNYGDSETPIDFIRIQVIIHATSIGIWLMPGKQQGSLFDREYFKKQMQSDVTYRQKFFDLLTSLPFEYEITVANTTKKVNYFKSSDDLWQFTNNDDYRYYYFIIGRDYPLGSPELKKGIIVDTIINEFKRLYPLYIHMKHPAY